MAKDPGKKGFVIPFNCKTHRFIIFSDQHKGRKNGADDFMAAENNYLKALQYYNDENFHLITLGDCEELWENTLLQVIKQNQPSFDLEKNFVVRNAFTKISGNHDLDWEIDPLTPAYLKKIYGVPMSVLQGIVLETTIGEKVLRFFCTHGHQGDLQSDGNWFSQFFVTKVWAPLQAYLRINPNTPAYDQHLKTAHNRMMYQWSLQQKDLILITGHTHQPVFESLTHFERLQWQQRKLLYEQNPEWAQALEDQMKWRSIEDTRISEDYLNMKPCYFNTGCCCYADGDITGIEIADDYIRLIKWDDKNDGVTKRFVLQERKLEELTKEL
ncbi:MAG TPA: metallophosphoesterase [Flavitalea sp.]|nr:metallophosphoesterase [Flavitalea sp.]